MSFADYPTLDDLLAAAEAFLAHTPEVRDIGLIESACTRPAVTVFGEEAYPTIHLKAAALVQSLVGNHGLVDGNKRLGYSGLYLMYGLNGYVLRATEDEKVDLIMAVAEGRLDTVEKVADRLASIAVRE